MDWRLGGQGWIGGHRGARAVAPENTMAAFELARAAGADYVETDVRMAADGTLILFHDDTLDRTTDGRGPVARSSPAELARLDAGSWFGPRFARERIPTLDQFLDWLEAQRAIGAVVEAKGRGTGGPLAARLAMSPAAARLAICGFSPVELRAARRARPDAVTILLLDAEDLAGGDPVDHVRAAQADGVGLIGRLLTTRHVAALRAAGLLVGGATRNRPSAVRRALRLGVDFLDSDRPDVAVGVRRAWHDPTSEARG